VVIATVHVSGVTALELHGPVRLPGCASIRGERLLPGWIGAGVGPPDEAHLDGSTVQDVVRQERTDCTGKASDHWWVQALRRAAIEPPDGPGSCLGIVRADGSGSDIPLGKVQDVVFNVAEASEDLPGGGSALKLGPVLAPLQARIQTPVGYLPGSDDEVEVWGRNSLRYVLHGPIQQGVRRQCDAPGQRSCRRSILCSEPYCRSCARLRGFGFSSARLGGCDQRLNELSRSRSNIFHGALERGLVRLGGNREAAELANELHRCVPDLDLGRWRFEIEQRLDVSAHHHSPIRPVFSR